MKALYPMTLRTTLFAVAALLVLQGCPVANGQGAVPAVGPVGDNVQPPQPGIGHDYIHLMSETVNPAKGSLSVRINFPAPKGRGITVPAYADYNSGQLSTLLDNNGGLQWATALNSDGTNYGYGTLGGWGMGGDGPLSANGGTVWTITTPTDSANDPAPPSPNSVTPYTCRFLSGLSYTDLNGTNHILPVGASFSPTTPAPISDPTSGQNGSCLGSGEFVGPGDTQVWAAVPTYTAAKMAGMSTNMFSVFIMDKDGNTMGTGAGNGSTPSGLEDRNGNQLGYSPSGGGFIGAMDTAGRPLSLGGWEPVSLVDLQKFPSYYPSCGANAYGAATCTYTVYGLNYTVTSGTAPVNYTVAGPYGPVPGAITSSNGTVIIPACPVSANGSGFPANSATMTVIKSITLPNGQVYQFSYDPTYGTMNEIIYPNGGWVKYTWGLNANMTLSAGFPGTLPNTGISMPGACGGTYETPVVLTRTVSYDGVHVAQTQTFTYNTGMNAQVTTTDNTSGNSYLTSYTYAASFSPAYAPFSNIGMASPPEVEQTVKRYDWGNVTNPLDTETKAWYNIFQLACEFHTNVNGLTSGHFYQYSNGLMVDDKEFDFTNGATAAQSCTPSNVAGQSSIPSLTVPPVRETVTALQAITNPMSFPPGQWTTYANMSPNTFYKPSTVTVYYKGTPVAETIYGYDESPVTAVQNLITGAGMGVHDETNFSANQKTGRGNVTTIHKVCLVSANCLDSITHFTYDETGQVTSMIDGLGNKTSYTYADNFTTNNNELNEMYMGNQLALTGQTNAYLKTITNALGQTTTFTYDWLQGDLIQAIDANNQPTTYFYMDAGDRLTATQDPDGGETTVTYNDGTYSPGGSSPSVTTSKLLIGSTWETGVAVSNGMGQVVQTIQDDPEGNVSSETAYDGEGRALTKTNPHRASASTTDGTSMSYYDALGRPTLQVQPDGSTVLTCYDGVASLYNSAVCKAHIGGAGSSVSWVDTQDESGNQWQRSTNGLGQMIQVEEPNGATAAPTMETDYGYDGLNNLTSVTQQGNGAANTSGTRARTFTYNSLSQLVRSNNPETGSIGYVYDADGNLFTKTDTRGVKVTYQYDPLNRLLAKTYNSGDPAACFQYDVPLAGSSDPYPIGRLTAEWTAPACPEPPPSTTPPPNSTAQVAVSNIPGAAYNSTVVQTHDAMGRTQLEAQCAYGSACGSTYQFSYAYDKAGGVTSFNNGMPAAANSASSPAITWGVTPNSAGQLQLLTVASQPWGAYNPAYPTTLINAATSTAQPAYDPLGHLVFGQFALNVSNTPAIYVARDYDDRGRIVTEADGGTTTTAAAGSETLTVAGLGGLHQVCVTVEIPEGPYHIPTPVQECNEVPDTGTIGVSVLGFTATANYNGPVPDATIAAQLAAGLNAAGSPVTATASGASITVTANVDGTAGDYALTITNGDYTVTGPSAQLTGGQNIVSTAGAFYSWQIGSYAPNGNILSLNDSVVGPWSYAYDTLNRLTAATAGAGNTHYANESGCWQYDAFGNRTKEAYSTVASTPCASGANDNAQLMNTPQSSANNNRLSTVSYDLAGNALNDGSNQYAYDGEGRLCAVAYPNGLGGWSYEQYVYDAGGTRVAKGTIGSLSCSAPITANGFTLSNQYLLGLDGEQVTELGVITTYGGTQASGTFTFTGSEQSRTLILPTGATTVYDQGYLQAVITSNAGSCSVNVSFGGPMATPSFEATTLASQMNSQCASMVTATANGATVTVTSTNPGAAYNYGISASLLSYNSTYFSEPSFTLTASGPTMTGGTNSGVPVTKTSWLHSNVWAGTRLDATYDAHGLHFAIADPLGTKRVQELISSTGAAAFDENCYSLPFGNDIGNPRATNCQGPGADATEHHFTGKERDTESGNDYFGDRYFASSMGRMLSPDPGNISAIFHMDDPQAWNGYAYAHNNPLRFTDPTGDTYQVCDSNGQNCSTMSDKTFEKDEASDKAHGEYFQNGTMFHKDGDGNNVTDGTYKQTDVDMPGDAGTNIAAMGRIGNEGMVAVNFMATNIAVTLGTAGVGELVGPAVSGYITASKLSMLKPLVTNPKLAEIVDELFQATDKIPGGTAGAVRFESESGIMLSPAGHVQDAESIAGQLNNLLKNPNTGWSSHDQAVAKELIRDLQNAVAGK